MKKILAGTFGVAVLMSASVVSAATMGSDTMMKDTMATGTMMTDTKPTDAMMMKHDDMMTDDDLMIGSRGDAVVILQTFLESKGHLVIPVGVAKGYFGSLTKSALKKYQMEAGVKATGYYGPLTRAAMHAAMMMKGDMMKPTN